MLSKFRLAVSEPESMANLVNGDAKELRSAGAAGESGIGGVKGYGGSYFDPASTPRSLLTQDVTGTIDVPQAYADVVAGAIGDFPEIYVGYRRPHREGSAHESDLIDIHAKSEVELALSGKSVRRVRLSEGPTWAVCPLDWRVNIRLGLFRDERACGTKRG